MGTIFVIAPLLAALCASSGLSRKSDGTAYRVGALVMVIGALWAWKVVISHGGDTQTVYLFRLLESADLLGHIALRCDGVSLVIGPVVMTLGAAWCVCLGEYRFAATPRMRDHLLRAKMTSYACLLVFFVNLFVFADDLIQLMFAWLGAGFVVYLMAGCGGVPVATKAASRVFVVHRISDVMVIAAMGLIFAATGEIQIDAVNERLSTLDGDAGLRAAAILIVLGALAKGGGIFFHLWVEDLAEATTPGAALGLVIGGFALSIGVLARLEGLITLAHGARALLAVGAGASALFHASCAIAQVDAKRAILSGACVLMAFLLGGVAAGAGEQALLSFGLVGIVVMGMLLSFSIGFDGVTPDGTAEAASIFERSLPWVFAIAAGAMIVFATFWIWPDTAAAATSVLPMSFTLAGLIAGGFVVGLLVQRPVGAPLVAWLASERPVPTALRSGWHIEAVCRAVLIKPTENAHIALLRWSGASLVEDYLTRWQLRVVDKSHKLVLRIAQMRLSRLRRVVCAVAISGALFAVVSGAF